MRTSRQNSSPQLTNIKGEPTCQPAISTFYILRKELDQNAIAIESPVGGGTGAGIGGGTGAGVGGSTGAGVLMTGTVVGVGVVTKLVGFAVCGFLVGIGVGGKAVVGELVGAVELTPIMLTILYGDTRPNRVTKGS